MNVTAAPSKSTKVCTDGIGRGDPRPGGWAWVVPGGPAASGGAAKTDKSRMELMAIHQALATLDGPLEAHCDSGYAIDCFRERWWESWVRRGWRNSDKKPITNRDLWSQIIEQTQTRPIAFHRAKPNTGFPSHDQAIRLAAQAADRQDTAEQQSPF